jgi:hypothetical protein
MKKYFVAKILVVSYLGCTACVGSAQAGSAAGAELCPRGTYELQSTAAKQNVLIARVTLPTPGYKLQLKVRPEKIEPPVVDFLCSKPSGIVTQVVTRYETSLPTPLSRLTVADKDGKTLVAFNASEQSCAKGQFLDTSPVCTAGAPGKCVPKPEVCTEEFQPVVGCDGKTYPNKCRANAAGVSVNGSWSFQSK